VDEDSVRDHVDEDSVRDHVDDEVDSVRDTVHGLLGLMCFIAVAIGGGLGYAIKVCNYAEILI
jgi:hypothetical protein